MHSLDAKCNFVLPRFLFRFENAKLLNATKRDEQRGKDLLGNFTLCCSHCIAIFLSFLTELVAQENAVIHRTNHDKMCQCFGHTQRSQFKSNAAEGEKTGRGNF